MRASERMKSVRAVYVDAAFTIFDSFDRRKGERKNPDVLGACITAQLNRLKSDRAVLRTMAHGTSMRKFEVFMMRHDGLQADLGAEPILECEHLCAHAAAAMVLSMPHRWLHGSVGLR
jgi:hypothetical protein